MGRIILGCIGRKERKKGRKVSAKDREEHEIHHTEMVEDYLEALEELTVVEDDEKERKVVLIFHNMRGFHGNFIEENFANKGVL